MSTQESSFCPNIEVYTRRHTQKTSLLRLLFYCAVIVIFGLSVIALDTPRLAQVSAAEDGQIKILAAGQPYVVHTNSSSIHSLTFTLHYLDWQNPNLIFDMQDADVTHARVKPEGANQWSEVELKQFNGEVTLNIGRYLIPGNNDIQLDVHSDDNQGTGLYIAPQLFGTHAISTVACLCIFVVLGAACFNGFRLAGMDRLASSVLVAGFTSYACLLFIWPNLAYTNDLPGHLSYLRYMIDGWTRPYDYEGWEHFHPPFYYFIAGQLFNFFTVGSLSPLLAVRFLALMLYMLFCFFGVRTLAEAVRRRGAAYIAGLCLIVFWPIAPTVATRISNDLAAYALWSAAFYYLAHWYNKNDIRTLRVALILTSVAFLFKTSSIVLVALTGICLAYALCRNKITWRELFDRRNLPTYCVMLLCALGNLGRVIYKVTHGMSLSNALTNYMSSHSNEYHDVSYFLGFHLADFIAHPTVTFNLEPNFLNYLLKTALYNETGAGALVFPQAILNALLVLLLIITFSITVITCARQIRAGLSIVPFVFGVLLPPFGPLFFMLNNHYMFCQNFRFILPVIIPFAVLFVRGMDALPRNLAGRLSYWLGLNTAYAFLFVGVFLNIWIYANKLF